MTTKEATALRALILRWECPKGGGVPPGVSAHGTFWSVGMATALAYGRSGLAVSNNGTNGAAFDGGYQVLLRPNELRLLSTVRVGDRAYPPVHTFPLIVDRDEFLAAARMCIAVSN